jgi:CheY-like chemotaxis protein
MLVYRRSGPLFGPATLPKLFLQSAANLSRCNHSVADAMSIAASAYPALTSIGPSTRMTVLVAEDDPVIRRFCYRTLRQAGYQVLEAEDGEAALHMIQSNGEIDLIVTDLTMPRLGGHEIAQVLSVFRPGLPVLGMSSSAYKLSPDRRLPVLAKPFSAATLISAVEEMRLRASSTGSWTEEKRAHAQELGRIAATVQLRSSAPPEKVDLVAVAQELRNRHTGPERAAALSSPSPAAKQTV